MDLSEGQRRRELNRKSFVSIETTARKKKKAADSLDCLHGADDEARTRYLHLGKVALYQMSYIRISLSLS